MRPSELDSEDLEVVSKSILQFTWDLCKIFAENIQGNYVCSGFSAHKTLSMAAYGANDNTAAQMGQVLHFCYPNVTLLDEYRWLLNVLNTDEIIDSDNEREKEAIKVILQDQTISEEERGRLIRGRNTWFEERKLMLKSVQCVATLANKIYIANGRSVKVQDIYENALNTYFQSKIETLKSLDRHVSADIINNWCIQTTNGKISDVIDSDEFADASALILVNAVHFEGTWQHQFVSARPKTFYLSISQKVQVPTMYIKTDLHYRYIGRLNAQSVRLDFLRSHKYMELIVPTRINGLRLIKKLLHRISNEEFKYVNVRLWLPRFEIESEIKFEEHLKKMGDAFDKDRANFNKICDKAVFIKTAIQKAYIKVDELGCVSTSVANVSLDNAPLRRKPPRHITVKANRPFFFRIMDSRLDIPLFVGTVVNPTNEFFNKSA